METWRMYLPDACKHPLKTGSICSGCVEKALEKLLDEIIENVSKFDAVVVCEGENETEEQKLINKYIDGTIQGYKDAVQQILDFLKDLKQ